MSEKVLDEKLVVVQDDDFENVSDFDDEFKRIADVVLNQTELIVCGKERFKIVEIEVKIDFRRFIFKINNFVQILILNFLIFSKNVFVFWNL